MAAKKTRKPIIPSDENELVRELSLNTEFVKNPFIYSQIRGDFSLMQSNVMVSILGQLQGRINDYLEKRKVSGPQGDTYLWKNDELKKGVAEFVVPLRELGVRADTYDQLEEACQKLLTLRMTYMTYDEETHEQKLVFNNIFSRIELPTSSISKDGKKINYEKGARRTGEMKIIMLADNAQRIFDMSNGYVEHMAHIVPLCRKARTPRIYIYLSRWKWVGHKTVEYMELKEYLGLVTYNVTRSEIKTNLYPEYNKFRDCVLNPMKKELDALAADNLVDFTFDYEPVYPVGRRTGVPKSIKFTINLSDMGRMRLDKNQQHRQKTDYEEVLKEKFGLTASDLSKIAKNLDTSMIPSLMQKIQELEEKFEKYHPLSINAYVTRALCNHIESLMPEEAEVVEEVIEQEKVVPQPDANNVDKKYLEAWDACREMMKDEMGEEIVDQYFSDVTVYKFIEDTKVLVLNVPSHEIYEYIETKLIENVRGAFYATFGEDMQLKYRLADRNK